MAWARQVGSCGAVDMTSLKSGGENVRFNVLEAVQVLGLDAAAKARARSRRERTNRPALPFFDACSLAGGDTSINRMCGCHGSS